MYALQFSVQAHQLPAAAAAAVGQHGRRQLARAPQQHAPRALLALLAVADRHDRVAHLWVVAAAARRCGHLKACMRACALRRGVSEGDEQLRKRLPHPACACVGAFACMHATCNQSALRTCGVCLRPVTDADLGGRVGLHVGERHAARAVHVGRRI